MKHLILISHRATPMPLDPAYETLPNPADDNAVSLPSAGEHVLILTEEEKHDPLKALLRALIPKDSGDTSQDAADSEDAAASASTPELFTDSPALYETVSLWGIQARLISEEDEAPADTVLSALADTDVIYLTDAEKTLAFPEECPLIGITVFEDPDTAPALSLPDTVPGEDLTTEALAAILKTALPTPSNESAEPRENTEPASPAVPFSRIIFEWVELFAFSLAAVLLIMTFFIRHSPVSGSSMTPTLKGGDVLLLTEFGFTPECGDIVIVQTPLDDLRKPLVKRVIATSGQTVRINFETWEIFINGERLAEPYLDSTDKSYVMELYYTAMYLEKVDPLFEIYETVVPDHHLFVMGDNRQNSKDSRTLGFIDERHVIGEVVYRILPFSSLGKLD
ncbi:MAG: signal peptidase I [Clostridia bacterium]|nr:signal peptidase I [Clostridia bacterium]